MILDILTMINDKYDFDRKRFDINTTLFQEYDQCNQIGIITKGSLVLRHFSFDGKEINLGYLNNGDVFGDFLIFSEEPYFPGNLIALEPTEVIFITKSVLIKLLDLETSFRYYYIKQLSDKALKLNAHNKLLNLHTLREKIILYLEKSTSKLEKNKVKIQSKKALANYLNVERPSLSRELKRMKDDKIIDYNRHFIWLISPK